MSNTGTKIKKSSSFLSMSPKNKNQKKNDNKKNDNSDSDSNYDDGLSQFTSRAKRVRNKSLEQENLETLEKLEYLERLERLEKEREDASIASRQKYERLRAYIDRLMGAPEAIAYQSIEEGGTGTDAIIFYLTFYTIFINTLYFGTLVISELLYTTRISDWDSGCEEMTLIIMI